MGSSRKQLKRGLTLVEVMVAAAAVLVIVVGAMNFQYYCALDARKADVRATASRLGLLLLEGWNTQGGIETYNPIADFGQPPLNDFGLGGNPGIPGLANMLGDECYRIKVNGAYYFVKLSYQDIADDLRMLNASVAWSRNFGSDTLDFHSRRLVSLTKYAYYTPAP